MNEVERYKTCLNKALAELKLVIHYLPDTTQVLCKGVINDIEDESGQTGEGYYYDPETGTMQRDSVTQD